MRRVAVFLFLALLPVAVAAAVIHVPGDQPAIRMGITAATTGDTVLVAAGVWTGSLNVNLDLYGKAITVLGAGPGETVIDCGGTARGFQLVGGETPATVIEGFSIVNGYGPIGGGGGIRIDGAAGTLRNLRIEGCTAVGGGGITVRNGVGTTSMIDVVLAENSASSGGGIYSASSDLVLERLTLVGNSAYGYGAALRILGGAFQLANSIVAHSTGMPAIDGSLSAEDFTCCDFYFNQAGDFAYPGLAVVGQNGNFAADPVFCDAAAGDYGLHAVSPCQPGGNGCGERIGAASEDCADPRLAISGRCTTANGLPVAATLSYPGGVAYAGTGGYYLVWVEPGWTGTLTPSYAGDGFLPPSRSYANLQENQVDQDFVLDHATLIRVPADEPTLQAALAAALDGDTLLVAPGTYAGTANTNLDLAGKNIVMIGEGGAAATILEGGHGETFGMAFRAGNGLATVVEGFTLRGFVGYSTGLEEGALICYPGSAPNLRNLRIEDNQAPIGGYDYTRGSGLFSWSASPTLIDCRFANNRATYGGAVRIDGGEPQFIRVEFVANRANQGGAVHGTGSDARFEHCSFAQNEAVETGDQWSSAPGSGGAAFAAGLAFVDCLFVENRADSARDVNGHPIAAAGEGGALRIEGGAFIERCTFVGNTAEADAATPPPGAAVHIVDGSATITASILAGANAGATAIRCAPGSGTADATCSVFWDNPGGNAGGDCADPVGADGNLEADPRFCDPLAGDYALDADSPCLPAHNACGLLIGAFGQGCGSTAAEAPPSPAGLALSSHPNPFNPSTRLDFRLPASATVSLGIYDLAGRLAATLIAGARREAGAQSAVWDGRLDAGGRATSGVYLARLAVGNRTAVHKLILLK